MADVLDRYQAIDPEKLDLGPETRVLDVGCGTGRHLLELSRFPGTFVGLDMLRYDLRVLQYILILKKREGERVLAKMNVVQGDAYHLPFPDGSFDRVLCTETLEHVPDDKGMMAELVRVLRPGGIMVISVPDEYSERLLWRFSARYRTHPGGHVRVYRRKAIARLLREHGAPPFAVQYRHALEFVRWFVRSVIDSDWDKPGRLTRAVCWLLDTPSHRNWPALAFFDSIGNRVLPKSIVLYARKAPA